MPVICSFNGIRITMNWRDHAPPHFQDSERCRFGGMFAS